MRDNPYRDEPFGTRLRRATPALAWAVAVNVVLVVVFAAVGWGEAAVRQLFIAPAAVLGVVLGIAFTGRRPW